jgi:UDP-N-acetylmuramyl pentapeptide phosphotransferase/UDP-N-acetylglucosamine-1-phosphate transferase
MPDIAGAWSMVGNLGPVVWLNALIVCALLIIVLTPVFRGFAVSVPTQRSSHSVPTPQWGGLAVSAATLGVSGLAILLSGLLEGGARHSLLLVLLAALLLVLLGAADDHYHLGPVSKLAVQAAAVALMLTALPQELRPLPFLPAWLERGVLFVGALWFVNVVNFMDGIDWMMVAEVVPVTIGVAIIGALGALPAEALVVALALNGAMLGFAPFNRPVARLFMGDMGSLPIGLLLAWLLIVVAGSGHLVAALLLPLYFLADTGITLLVRARAGERLWVAHRTHFYQRARDNGFTNIQIVGRVFAVNAALVALAALSVTAQSAWSGALALLAGACLVVWLLIGFVRHHRP